MIVKARGRSSKRLTASSSSSTAGGRPMLVVFEEVQLNDLEPERHGESIRRHLAYLKENKEDPILFEAVGQTCNFRLKPNRGIVGKIELIE